MVLSANSPAPEFSLPDENGVERSIREFRGKPVILYFYPKDDTPGCTTEACNFRDDYHIYGEQGVVILGVSPEFEQISHQIQEQIRTAFPPAGRRRA